MTRPRASSIKPSMGRLHRKGPGASRGVAGNSNRLAIAGRAGQRGSTLGLSVADPEHCSRARTEPAVQNAPLGGRRAALRPLAAKDHTWLYDLSTREENGFRWRYGGATPSPESFVRSLWDQVLVQFVIERRRDRRPAGLVVAYSADLHHGHAQIAVLLDPSFQRQAWPF